MRIYTATRKSLRCRDGNIHSITEPLIVGSRKPTGGWSIRLLIKGMLTRVGGMSPNEVFTNAVDLLNANGEKVRMYDLWLTMNLQWSRKTPDKYMLASEKDLLAISRHVDVPIAPAPQEVQTFPPAIWGARAWKFMAIYLAMDADRYEWDEFRRILVAVRKMLDDDTIGCQECYDHSTEWFRQAFDSPLVTREEARMWLWNFHNKVNSITGQRLMTIEEAKEANHWV